MSSLFLRCVRNPSAKASFNTIDQVLLKRGNETRVTKRSLEYLERQNRFPASRFSVRSLPVSSAAVDDSVQVSPGSELLDSALDFGIEVIAESTATLFSHLLFQGWNWIRKKWSLAEKKEESFPALSLEKSVAVQRVVSSTSFSSRRSSIVDFSPINRVSKRNFASIGTDCSRCSSLFEEVDELERLLSDRRIREVNLTDLYARCQCKKSDFSREESTCLLIDMLKRKALELLLKDLLPDVYLRNPVELRLYLEALVDSPPGNVASMGGDHGKIITEYISALLPVHKVKIEQIVDIGGQSNETVLALQHHFGKIFSTVVDVNILTPFIAPQDSSIQYVLGDSRHFFEEEFFRVCNLYSSTLVVLDNFLNVLTPEKGWENLYAAWHAIEPGSYIAISGLAPEYLARYGMQAEEHLCGIHAFHDSRGFYKSALTVEFGSYILEKLENSTVLHEEEFLFKVALTSGNQVAVRGRRLIIQKN